MPTNWDTQPDLVAWEATNCYLNNGGWPSHKLGLGNHDLYADGPTGTKNTTLNTTILMGCGFLPM